MSELPPTPSPTLWARGGKRAFDFVFGLLLLVALAPFLLLAAILVKATSRGPVLFIQERAGKTGALFRLYKFRTMRGHHKPDPDELVPLDHADITPVGWCLRRFKIDELPQLLHVLRGDMSLVGPRPTLPDQVAAYDAFQRQRLLVRPGITGLAQVYGNTSMPWDERILFDVAYVRRCSLRLDVFIMLRTLHVLVVGERRTSRPFLQTPFADYLTPSEIRACAAGRNEHRWS